MVICKRNFFANYYFWEITLSDLQSRTIHYLKTISSFRFPFSTMPSEWWLVLYFHHFCIHKMFQYQSWINNLFKQSNIHTCAKCTHPPNKANFSFPSTLQHKMLPPEHTFHIFGESIQEDTVDESTSSMDLMLAFPLVVHVSRVQSLKITTSKWFRKYKNTKSSSC